jgi:hypothetical protein
MFTGDLPAVASASALIWALAGCSRASPAVSPETSDSVEREVVGGAGVNSCLDLHLDLHCMCMKAVHDAQRWLAGSDIGNRR